MTGWQDQHMGGGAGGTAVDPATGQPMSRRAAREAERRAAEALAEKQPHPSGVVDFEAHDFGSEFSPDQDFNVGDTQDIWAALTRGQQQDPRRGTDDLGRFRTGVPEVPTPARDDTNSVSGELLDRVRDAVLRRSAEAVAPAAPPTAPVARQPQPEVPAAFDAGGATRRRRREQEAAEIRDDGLPNSLFADPRLRPAPQPAFPQDVAFPQAAPEQPGAYPAPVGYEAYGDDADDYYDEPYAPEPTIAIPLASMEIAPPVPATSPVRMPQTIAEPAGDDLLTFSSPIPALPVDYRDDHLPASADAAFIAPADPWGLSAADRTSGSLPVHQVPVHQVPVQQQPVQYAAPQFVEPAAQFQHPQLGPPSEVTDLAGFEQLIRKARQQPAPQPAAPAANPVVWADEDVQEGFTGLLGRSVQGSHGSSNALILPHDGQPDMTKALDSNGDIFITGSMNLSRSLSTTGAAVDLYDSHEIDRLYEVSQEEPAAGVAPVRASKAVSGGAHDRQIVGTKRGRGNVLPTVLAIVASVMAVGVVTLLVGSWVLRIF